MNFSLRLMRRPAVSHATGDGRSTHYKKVAEGLCTPPVQIGERAVGWPEHEIYAINAARIAGKSNDEIRELVKKLVAARKFIAERGLP